jgi:hypothetical protein
MEVYYPDGLNGKGFSIKILLNGEVIFPVEINSLPQTDEDEVQTVEKRPAGRGRQLEMAGVK